MAEFASKGVAGSGLGLGIAGTALGLLNGGGNGMLRSIGLGYNTGNCCAVSQFELMQNQRISELESQVALRDANIYNDQKLLDMYKYFDSQVQRIDKSLCEQAVFNATQTGTMSTIAGQVAQLMSLTKLVVPNTSVCPGWGNVDVTITPTTTTPTTPAA